MVARGVTIYGHGWFLLWVDLVGKLGRKSMVERECPGIPGATDSVSLSNVSMAKGAVARVRVKALRLAGRRILMRFREQQAGGAQLSLLPSPEVHGVKIWGFGGVPGAHNQFRGGCNIVNKV